MPLPNPQDNSPETWKKRPRQASEMPRYSDEGLNRFDEKARDLADRLETTPDMEAMLALESKRKPEVQQEGLSLMEGEIIAILTAIQKADPEFDLKKVKPSNLARIANDHDLVLTPTEQIAWEKYNEIVTGRGPTAHFLAKRWKGLTEQAHEASLGWTDKIKESFEKNPGGTAAIALAGAAGLWLGFKFLGSLGEWVTSDEGDAKEKEGFMEGKWAPLTLMAVGLILGKDELKKLLAAKMGMEQAKAAAKQAKDAAKKAGTKLPNPLKKDLEELATPEPEVKAAGVPTVAAAIPRPPVYDRMKSKPERRKKIETHFEESEVVEYMKTDDAKVSTAAETLTHIYSMNSDKFPEHLHSDIRIALKSFSGIKSLSISDVLSALDKTKDEKISANELELKDANPEAVFHAAKIVKITYEFLKVNNDFDIEDISVRDLLLFVAKDPAFGIHKKFLKKLHTLDLTDLSEDTLDEVFSEDLAQELFSDDVREQLMQKYRVEVPKKYKGQFTAAISKLYLQNGNLNWSADQVHTELSAFESVWPYVDQFHEALKIDLKGKLPRIIDHYDRPHKETKYDRLLEKHLSISNLSFKHGLQLAILAEDMSSGKANDKAEHMIHGAKEIAMITVLANSLKHINNDTYNAYLGLWAAILVGSETNVNIPAIPHMKKAFGVLAEKGKGWFKKWLNRIGALESITDKEGYIDKIAESDFMEFGTMAGTEGLVVPTQLIYKLADTLGENFGPLLTDPEIKIYDVMEWINAVGGTVFFSETADGEMRGAAYVFGEFFLIRPFGITWDSMKAFAEHNAGTAVQTYTIGMAPYMALSGLNAARVPGSLLKKAGAFLGAGLKTWATAPVTAPIQGLNLPISTYRTVREGERYAESVFNNWVRFRGVGSVPTFQNSIRYFQYYDDMSLGESVHIWDKLKAIKDEKGTQALRHIYQDLYLRQQRRWAVNFVRDYHRFFGINPAKVAESDNYLKIPKGEIKFDDYRKYADRMGRLMEKISKMDDLEGLSRSDLMGRFRALATIEDLTGEKLIKPNELLKLEGKIMGDPKKAIKPMSDSAFKRFKKSLSKARVEGKLWHARWTDKIRGAKDAASEATPASSSGKVDIFEQPTVKPESVDLSRLEKPRKNLSRAIQVLEDRIAAFKRIGNPTNDLETALLHKKHLLQLLEWGDSPHTQFVAKYADEVALFTRDMETGKRALDYFLSIDEKVLYTMRQKGAWDELANHFKALGDNMNPLRNGDVAGMNRQTALAKKHHLAIQKLTDRFKVIDDWVPESASPTFGMDFEIFEGPKFRTDDLVELAKMKSTDDIVEALKAKGIPSKPAAQMAEDIAGTRNVEKIHKIIAENAEEAGAAVKFSRPFKHLLRLARLSGAALSTGGMVFSGIESYSAFSEMLQTDNKTRQALLAGRGTLHAANVIVDGAATWALGSAAMGAAGGGAVATIGALALPLAPITYGVDTALDSSIEATKTAEEWAEADYRNLIQNWIETDFSGASDALRVFTSQEEIKGEKENTRSKLLKAILFKESGAADPDRMHYIYATTFNQPPRNYHKAVELLRESQLYADIMKTRRQMLAEKQEDSSVTYVIDGIDLLHPKYEHVIERREFQKLFKAFERHTLSRIPKGLKRNFDHFSDAYLIDLFAQAIFMANNPNIEDLSENQIDFAMQLQGYLTHVRHIDINKAIHDWQMRQLTSGTDKVEFAELTEKAAERVAHFQKSPSTLLREDLEHQSSDRGVNALAELARFFGYTGNANEEELKLFFDEEHGGTYGVYFDGEEWVANEAGMESDNELGAALNAKTIEALIGEWEYDLDNVIETRQDALVDTVSLEAFVPQVKEMISVLKRGLQKTPPQFEKLTPASASLPEAIAETEVPEEVMPRR